MTDPGVNGDDPRTVSIPALLRRTARDHGDQVAVVDGETKWAYRDLLDQVRTFGAALVDAEIQPGDRVAIWAPNGAEWIAATLGIFAAGAVLVPVNTRFKGAEAAEILGRSHARLLVTVTEFLGLDYVALLDEHRSALPDLNLIVVAHGPARSGTESWTAFTGRGTDAGRSEVDGRSAALTATDPSDILFTSGTTGSPKGVVQTHGRTLRVANDWVAMTGLKAGDRYLMVNPYFHMFGLKAGILASISAGATMLPEQAFDPARAMARIAAEQVTVFPGAPTLYQSILDHPDRAKFDLSSLRVAVTGAADIPVELIRRIDAELPFSVIITGYGLTEGGTATATAAGDDVETVATTVGRPRPGFELRIMDGAGQDVAGGEPGEVLLRGGSVMSHYLDDPVATAEALSSDGWLSTGDLGTLDDAGNLRIVGRSKDMFIVGGFNAYPAEIENALLRHPEIQQVAVIGVPDDRLGEVGMAFVVIAPGSSTTEEELVAWGREQMANYKAPRSVRLVDELPVNATGKVVKETLRGWVSGSIPE